MNVRHAFLAGATLAIASCTSSPEPLVERGSAQSLDLVARALNRAVSPRFSSGDVPTAEARVRLGRGLAIDIITARSDVIDGHNVFLVASSVHFEPFVLASAADATRILHEWWPESGAELLAFCAIAARAQWRWHRATAVLVRGEVPSDIIAADGEQVWRLGSPSWENHSNTQAGVDFWLVRSGGSSKIRCRVTREAPESPQLFVESVDSVSGLGYLQLGG